MSELKEIQDNDSFDTMIEKMNEAIRCYTEVKESLRLAYEEIAKLKNLPQ